MKPILYALGVLMIIAGLVFATRVDATNTTAAVQTLPARPSRQSPALIARNDAFAPLPLRNGGGQTPIATIGPPFFGRGPNPQVATVPNPSAPGSTGQQLVVLCTVFSGPKARLEFLVGDRVVYAGIGTIVGGYRVANVETDRVHFDDGEILEMSDCGGALRTVGVVDAAAPNATSTAAAGPTGLAPTATPPAAPPRGLQPTSGMLTGPSVAGPSVQAPTVTTGATNGLYGGQTSAYGSAGGASVYGQPLPGAPPGGASLNGQQLPIYVPHPARTP